MDPISALSIVCNIVQLVELGSKVVSEAHEIYTSVEGASDETVTLQTVTDDLSQLTWTLRQSLRQANAGPPLSRDAQALEKLGRACAETAQQLQELLPSFAGSGRPGAWQSARLAIRSLTTRPKRQALLANLRDLRDQLALRINTDIRSVTGQGARTPG